MRTFFKRISLYASPILILGVVSALWIQFLKPMALDFMSDLIPKLNSSQKQFKISFEKVDISILKLQLIAYGVKVNPNPELVNLQPVLANNMIAQLDIFDLIVGRINVSKLIIESANWTYFVKSSPTDSKAVAKPEIENIFKYLKIIPIDRLIVNNSTLQLKFENPKSDIKLKISQLNIHNNQTELSANTRKLNLEYSQIENTGLVAEINFNLNLNPKVFKINSFEARALDSALEFSAELRNLNDLIEHPVGLLKFNSNVSLQDIRSLMLDLFPQKTRFPAISGVVESRGTLELKPADNLTGDVKIKTTQVVLDHFKLGQAQINASIRKNQIELNEINLEHPSGKALLKNVKIDQRPPYNFSTQLEINSFDLQKLFLSLGLNDIPAGLLASGHAQCQGTLSNFETQCNVDSELKDIWVKPDIKDNFNILKLKSGRLLGEAKFTKEAVTYSTEVQIGSSKGLSSGRVKYSEGFHITYETEELDFNNVESLADLNFKGLLKIKGETHGDSDHGVMSASISIQNAVIDDFKLGNLTSNLDYKNLHLDFNNLSSKIGQSELTGQLNFNFNDNTSLTAILKSDKIYGQDAISIISTRFNLPFNLTGAGQANLQLSGPLDFWKLNYDFNLNLTNGLLADEKFETLNLNLISNGDQIDFKNVTLNKLKSKLSLTGFIDTTPKEPGFNLKLKANPFMLEEIDHLLTYTPTIVGIGYADGEIKGPLSLPEIKTNFTLKQVSYEKVEYPNSQGQFIIDKNYFKFLGQFFGRQIQSDIVWPWDVHNHFSAKIQVRDLNPLYLLPLLSMPQPSSDFYSQINAEIDLSAKTRNISEADGYIRINDFILQRGIQLLKLQNPSNIYFKNGLSKMDNINLKSDSSYLNIKMTSNSNNNVRLNVDGDLQLRMFHFLVPFAQTLSGNLVLDSQIVLKNNTFELLGEGELTDGLISLKGFPQAIDNINTPIEFSKSKIFLSDITGQLGQSDVTGIGQIDIIGNKNIQVNLRAVADNVEINFPDKILTGGKANVLFSGNWLPYKLKVDYKVSHGLVEKDFEADPSQGQYIKASTYLPPQQIEQLSPSLALEINIDLTKSIIVKNKLIEGEATGQLNILGTPESPVIKGQIDIARGSKLIFKDKPFDIQSASINFQQSKDINPMVYVSANSRVSDYDINLLVQGLSKNLSIKPTSQPPLAENEIFSLLALGVTTQTNQNLSSETQQKQTGLEVLAAISNQSQLNKKIQEKLGLTLQLAPSVDSTKNIAVPKVVVSKKISNKINASYSKPFTGNDQNQEIKVQYQYNSNISVLLNYQNKDTTQQDQSTNTNNTKSVLGLDLEYRDEFK